MQEKPPDQILCMQSGTIGLMLDARSLRLLHAGRFGQVLDMAAAIERGSQDLVQLPAVDLKLQVIHNGIVYRCAGRGEDPRDEFYFPVRFIESGRHLQRVAIDAIRLVADGQQLPELKGHLEFALWPDRCTLQFGVETPTDWHEGQLVIEVDTHRSTAPLAPGGFVTATLIKPTTPRAFIENPSSAPTNPAGDRFEARWDAGLDACVVHLPMSSWKNSQGTYYPSDELDRLDRWPLILHNDSDQDTVIPLMFVPQNMPAITGLTPMLCDPDGTPTGLPVQTSKNWHVRPTKEIYPIRGPGCMRVRLCDYRRMPGKNWYSH